MNVIVMLSEGIDSMACVEFYLEQGYIVKGIFFDYGQATLCQIADVVSAVYQGLGGLS